MNGGGHNSVHSVYLYIFLQKKRENEREQQRERRRGEKHVDMNKRSLKGLSGKLSHLMSKPWQEIDGKGRRNQGGREAGASPWPTSWTLRTSCPCPAGPGILELGVVSLLTA